MRRGWEAVVAALMMCAATGCAVNLSPTLRVPFADSKGMTEHETKVIDTVRTRNGGLEDREDWIELSYQRVRARKLDAAAVAEVAKYQQYVVNRAVYVIVHPAYYTFFDGEEVPERQDWRSRDNTLDAFLSESTYSSITGLAKAQDKAMRDFLEYASTEGALVILILPRATGAEGDYREYARFINEVTNDAPSVLYLYSKAATRGALTREDRSLFSAFIKGLDVDSVLVGGGYVGRCIEDFHKNVEDHLEHIAIHLIPEISALAPSDVSYGRASDLLLEDGRVDVHAVSKLIANNELGNQGYTPATRNLTRADIVR